jgi:hypothetical protein
MRSRTCGQQGMTSSREMAVLLRTRRRNTRRLTWLRRWAPGRAVSLRAVVDMHTRSESAAVPRCRGQHTMEVRVGLAGRFARFHAGGDHRADLFGLHLAPGHGA